MSRGTRGLPYRLYYKGWSNLLRLIAEGALEPLACVGGKRLRRGFGHSVLMLMGGSAKEAQLPAVAAAPLAQDKMQTQPEPLQRRQGLIERF